MKVPLKVPLAPATISIPTLYAAKRWYVLGALRLCDGSVSAAARALGIERSTLQRMLKKFRSP